MAPITPCPDAPPAAIAPCGCGANALEFLAAVAALAAAYGISWLIFVNAGRLASAVGGLRDGARSLRPRHAWVLLPAGAAITLLFSRL